jgi:hypothetical protein
MVRKALARPAQLHLCNSLYSRVVFRPLQLTLVEQTLESSLANAKASLPSNIDDFSVLPSLNDDDDGEFELHFDTAIERIRALMDFAAAVTDDTSERDGGWQGVIDAAKARLLHAQVPHFTILWLCLAHIMNAQSYRRCISAAALAMQPTITSLQVRPSLLFFTRHRSATFYSTPGPPLTRTFPIAVRQRQLLIILRAACFSITEYLDATFRHPQPPSSAASLPGMCALRQV